MIVVHMSYYIPPPPSRGCFTAGSSESSARDRSGDETSTAAADITTAAAVARKALPSRYVQPARAKFLVRTYSSNGEKKSVTSGPTPACDVPQRCRRPAPRYVQT